VSLTSFGLATERGFDPIGGHARDPVGGRAQAKNLRQHYLGCMKAARSFAVALVIFAAGGLAGIIFHAHHWQRAASARPGSEASVRVALENGRVAVSVVDLPPGARRPGRTRPTDELVLFCEESHYQVVDAQGHAESRDRMPGTVVWHDKGDLAPALVNPGPKPVRLYSVSLKQVRPAGVTLE
jgi:hypothetical protein